MMDPTTITAIGAFTALSIADEDYLHIDPDRCSGLGDAPLRTTLQPIAGGDGVNVFPPLDDAWILTIVGDLVVTSTGLSSEAGYRAAVSALYATLKAALDTGKTAPIELTHAGGTLNVWKNGPLDPTWQNFHMCAVTFSVVVDVTA